MQQKMYLIKKSSGIIYNFYFSKSGGICYKLYSLQNNEKIDPFEISITDEKILEFHATIDNEDRIHILSLTDNGDLKYFVNEDNIWNNKVFSHFDLRSNIVKSLFILVSNNKLYIMYAASNLMNVNLWTIYFKCWDGQKWNNTNIGMTVSDKDFPPYCVAIDPQKNIYVVYKNSSHRGAQLFYRKFHMEFSLWSSPEKIISSPDVIGYYYAFCDTQGYLHLTWATITGSKYKLLYKKLSKKLINHRHSDRILTISMADHAYLQPIMCEVEHNLWVMWKKEGEFSGCEIDDSGLSCSTVFPIQHTANKIPILVKLISNYELEKQSFNGYLLYGIVDDFISLILPQNYNCDQYNNPITESDDTASNSENAGNEIIPTKTAVQINEKFDIAKLDNKEALQILEDLKNEMSKQDVLDILKEIRHQNSELMQLISQALRESAVATVDEEKKDGILRKVFGIFK